MEATHGDFLPVLNEPSRDDRYDLALVPVRSEQLASTLPILLDMGDRPDVLFFGNTVGQQTELVAALGERALFGFPAAGGVRDGVIVRYVLIRQQKTMLGEPEGPRRPGLPPTGSDVSAMPAFRPRSAPRSAPGCSVTVPSSCPSRSRSIGSIAIRPRSPPMRAPCG